jgi:hypothetical protein
MSARLILHVRDPAYIPTDIAHVEQQLREVGLIGEPWGEVSQQRYLIGERFLQLVTFLGCAPAIELEPQSEQKTEFCHIGISPIYPMPRFLADTQGVLPRCPHCRKRFADWQNAIEQWQADSAFLTQCPACHNKLSPTELDWQHSAGFGCFFISIFNIYPGEAIPTETLMHALKESTNQTWNYFYLREEQVQ